MTSPRCFGLLALLPAALGAQQPADTVTLKPVVVTATRLPTSPDALTAAVAVLPGDELRARGVTQVADALRGVPGAAVAQTGSFGGLTSLFLRGGESDYVKVLVDGVPLNQPGGAFDFANLTTDDVERIEVLRGPASVVYGSDAVTGVVQIFTRRRAGAARAAASVRAGSYGSFAVNAEAWGGGPDASWSLGVSRRTTDGVLPFNNAYRNSVFAGLVHVAPDERSDATLSVRYGDDRYDFPTDGAGNVVDRNQFTYGSGPVLGLDAGRWLTPRLEARVLLALSETDGGFDDRQDGPADTTGFYGFQSLDHVRRASADVRANVHLGAATVLTGGAALERESQRSFSASQSQYGPSDAQLDVRRRNAAYYAQLVTDVARRVTLNLGARLEDNERFGTFATYRVGAAWRLAGGARVRVSAGTGFKEPTFFENYSSGFAIGNPALKPERTRSWELGAERDALAGRVTFSASYFDQRFRDLIDYTFSPSPPDTANYFNVAGATARGVEAAVRAAPVRGLSLAVTYTYLRTRVTDAGFDPSPGAAFARGQPLLRRPAHAASLDIAYQAGTRGTVSLEVGYVGTRADQDYASFPAPRVTLPAYTLVNLAGMVEVIRPQGSAPGVTATARIENLFDRAYQQVRNFPAPRRTLLFGVEARFGS